MEFMYYQVVALMQPHYLVYHTLSLTHSQSQCLTLRLTRSR